MNTLNDILDQKRKEIKENQSKAPTRVNLKWETATEFCKYCGFPVDKKMVVFVLGLCKRYGDSRVYGLKSWIKDYSYDPKRLAGLLVWKLKEDLKLNKPKIPLTTSY